jgi:hypothetical protein
MLSGNICRHYKSEKNATINKKEEGSGRLASADKAGDDFLSSGVFYPFRPLLSKAASPILCTAEIDF